MTDIASTAWHAASPQVSPERDLLIYNLLVQIHLIIEMILVDRPCAMVV